MENQQLIQESLTVLARATLRITKRKRSKMVAEQHYSNFNVCITTNITIIDTLINLIRPELVLLHNLAYELVLYAHIPVD